MEAEQCVWFVVRYPARDRGTPVPALDDVAQLPEQLDHQRVHEFGGPTRAYDAGDRLGEGKAWKRGDNDIVPICRKWIEQTFKFKK
jgi:hypothetical protein